MPRKKGSTNKKKTKDEFASEWMEQIKAGMDYRKEYSTQANWDKYRKYYRGQWDNELVPINKMFSYGRMMVPKVYFRAPRVSVTATHPELIEHARVVEAIDNLMIQEMMLKYTMKRSALDGFQCGVGPIKLGYDSQFGYIPEQAVDEDGSTVTQVSTKHEGTKIEYHQNIKPGMPWALRERPEDVIVPWGTGDPHNLPWVAHYVLRPIDDVKQDQKYQNTEDLQGTRTPQMGKDIENGAPYRPRDTKDKGTVYCELWEIRDVKTQSVMVICEDTLLMSTHDELQTSEGLPWEFLMFNPDPEYFWAIPDAHIIAPQQEELNETSTQIARHRAITLIKFLYKRGAIKETELQSFFSGTVGPGIAIEDTVDSLQNAIQIMQPHIPPDLYRDAQAQIQAMREELGFSQNQEGSFSPYHGKTASESMIVAQAFEDRIDERKDIVGDTLIRIIKKWNQFLFRFWSEQRVIQIVSPESGPVWVQYTGDELAGEYMLNVDVDTGMPINRAMKQQMGSQLFQALNGDPLIDQLLLRQIALDQFSMFDPRVDRLLQPQMGGVPELLARGRQPHPGGAGAGQGKGSGGGQTGATPDNPKQFQQHAKQVSGGE